MSVGACTRFVQTIPIYHRNMAFACSVDAPGTENTRIIKHKVTILREKQCGH